MEVRVFRIYEIPTDKNNKAHHKMRRKAVINLINQNHLDVKKDEGWDKLSGDVPHEYANLIFSLGSADAFRAIVSAFKILINRKEIDSIKVLPDGQEKDAQAITEEDLKVQIKCALGLFFCGWLSIQSFT